MNQQNKTGSVLLLDAGNTSVHVGYGTEELFASVTCKHEQIIRIVDQWTRWEQEQPPANVLLASVNPKMEETLTELVDSTWGQTVQRFRRDFDTTLSLNVKHPDELGEDRILNATAAWNRMQGPCVIVDAGTAITVDLVSGDGEFSGGVILPGVGMGAESLHAQCSLLPRVNPEPVEERYGTDTRTSIQAGIYHGFTGMLRNVLEKIRPVFEQDPEIIGVGGDVSFFVNAEPSIFDEIDEALTLRGLLDCWREPSTNRGDDPDI